MPIVSYVHPIPFRSTTASSSGSMKPEFGTTKGRTRRCSDDVCQGQTWFIEFANVSTNCTGLRIKIGFPASDATAVLVFHQWALGVIAAVAMQFLSYHDDERDECVHWLDAASVQGLAVELLEQIFLCCVELDASSDSYSDDHFSTTLRPPPQAQPCRHSPWNLTRVSREWNSTALNYKELWTSVSVNLNVDPLFSDYGAIAEVDAPFPVWRDSLLKLQLQRAGILPLRVKLTGPLNPFVGLPGFQRLLDSSHRWATLVFGVNIAVRKTLQVEIEKQLSDLPELEALILPLPHHIMPSIASRCPKLKRLVAHPLVVEQLQLDLTKVTQYDSSIDFDFALNGAKVGPGRYLESMAQMKALRRYRIQLENCRGLRGSAVTFALTSFSLKSDNFYGFDLLTQLTLPNLRSLDLYGFGVKLQYIPLNVVLGFLSRVRVLTEVRLGFITLPEYEGRLILAAVPRLKSLVLDNVEFERTLVSTLVQDQDLLPALSELLLFGQHPLNQKDLERLRNARTSCRVEQMFRTYDQNL
ncbi:hypothetical protein C8J56DRAFT_1054609 [Mycena floridula]|nr:hypothetical protein C8J56DRAFT_1054609 [Mycena floridula]